MLIPKDKIDDAKRIYNGQAIQDIIEHFHVDNYNEHNRSCSCPFHHDKTPSFIWNDKTNCFHCFSCGKNFGIIDLYLEKGMTYLEAVQTLFDKTNTTFSFGERGLQSKPTYKYPKHEDNDRSSVEKYLSLRKISPKTLDYTDVQSDKSGNIAFHYYDNNDVLLTVKYRPSHQLQKGEKKNFSQVEWVVDEKTKKKIQETKDTSPILFNMNRIDPSKPLVITEGEIDTLSILEAGYTNVVSVPFGAQNTQWIEYNWEWLEQFNKIIVWSDNDEPGIKMRNDVTRRLGTWRTCYIEITDTNTQYTKKVKLCKDANEILYCYGKERILEYINNPIEVPVENVSDLSEAEDFDIEHAEGLLTGIEDLDSKIYKLVFGTVNIITGKSGEGKSVFVNQIAICQALQQCYDVFVFSGELPAPVLKNWVETNMIGRDKIEMKNGHIRKFIPEARATMQKWYKGRVMIYDDSVDTTAKSLLIKMEEMARKFGTKVFLIDNLMMVDLECSEDGRLQAEKNFIKDLIFFAKKFNVLVFLVAHPRKTGDAILNKEDISGSSNIVNLAHMVFSVHRYTDKELEGETNLKGDFIKGKEPKKYDSCVSVLKNRITGLLPTTELYFDYPSYRFYRTPKELWFRYAWNTDQSPLNTNDPNPHEETPFNE